MQRGRKQLETFLLVTRTKGQDKRKQKSGASAPCSCSPHEGRGQAMDKVTVSRVFPGLWASTVTEHVSVLVFASWTSAAPWAALTLPRKGNDELRWSHCGATRGFLVQRRRAKSTNWWQKKGSRGWGTCLATRLPRKEHVNGELPQLVDTSTGPLWRLPTRMDKHLDFLTRSCQLPSVFLTIWPWS